MLKACLVCCCSMVGCVNCQKKTSGFESEKLEGVDSLRSV
jgi:hypothetical protein